MKSCKRCGSHAINPHRHGRDNTDLDLCDVCYWRTRAEAAFNAGMELETTALKSRIVELERIAEANSIVAMEARQNERTAMAYLNDVRRIFGDCDYPTMVEQIDELRGQLYRAEQTVRAGRQAAANIHDALLRGEDDTTLLRMMTEAYGEKVGDCRDV